MPSKSAVSAPPGYAAPKSSLTTVEENTAVDNAYKEFEKALDALDRAKEAAFSSGETFSKTANRNNNFAQSIGADASSFSECMGRNCSGKLQF
ncbi:hypothetical protein PRIPAC_79293 [Pristionchus pacificus]|uniref:Uncharacterized protein n=1 Tax=Pristionchus pacificus TaxID=54126 RepID=A0A2A6CJC9_PRIPA|nr:hypothetical protein PRIPAC_79293 [Pristionchus pacificus]|eukprot:PDM78312.1 hypothetical protein PRIPAC_30891 [Pristionchus pacificus]